MVFGTGMYVVAGTEVYSLRIKYVGTLDVFFLLKNTYLGVVTLCVCIGVQANHWRTRK